MYKCDGIEIINNGVLVTANNNMAFIYCVILWLLQFQDLSHMIVLAEVCNLPVLSLFMDAV